MRSVYRSLASCFVVLCIMSVFIGAALPVAAADVWYSTSTTTPYPSLNTDAVVWVDLSYDKASTRPIVGEPVHTVWNFDNSTQTLDWHTGDDGKAAMILNVGNATSGFTVRVDIFTGNSLGQIDSVYFTPLNVFDKFSQDTPIVPRTTPPAYSAPTYSPPASSVPAPQASAGPVAGSYGVCPSGYPVKANDNSGIYHVPGGEFYDATNARNCFATTAAAQAAGYRASLR
jgi:hypothetical protein